ncbi:hypothetical protein BDV96DRAFT_118406 [Lophiotrema nucula]|uniref:Uncharacterized protein n=1 Tax=Lophiotrema nucula TaxID=690887 RepID=A0A6A5Z345_9PLEO|nr:hypothetical protein BDV96DRAFT_118406 [Lophiotrema nucula]
MKRIFAIASIAFITCTGTAQAAQHRHHEHHSAKHIQAPRQNSPAPPSSANEEGIITGGCAPGLTDMLEAPGQAIVKNNCGFDVYMQAINPGWWRPSQGGFKLGAGQTYVEQMRYCESDCGGVSMKVWADSTFSGPLTQLEYTIVPSAGELWYDMSYVNCAKKADGEINSIGSFADRPETMPTDASACPGHAHGMSVSSNAPNSDRFHCKPNEYCPSQIYFVDSYVAHNMPMKEPTARCGNQNMNSDVTFEICKYDFAYPKRSVSWQA